MNIKRVIGLIKNFGKDNMGGEGYANGSLLSCIACSAPLDRLNPYYHHGICLECGEKFGLYDFKDNLKAFCAYINPDHYLPNNKSEVKMFSTGNKRTTERMANVLVDIWLGEREEKPTKFSSQSHEGTLIGDAHKFITKLNARENEIKILGKDMIIPYIKDTEKLTKIKEFPLFIPNAFYNSLAINPYTSTEILVEIADNVIGKDYNVAPCALATNPYINQYIIDKLINTKNISILYYLSGNPSLSKSNAEKIRNTVKEMDYARELLLIEYYFKILDNCSKIYRS